MLSIGELLTLAPPVGQMENYMSGLRIHHTSHRNCTIIVEHPGEIKSFLKTKNKGRKAKDYHIRLDNEGNCIVSEVIWKRLQETGEDGFIVLNEVQDPPVQYAGFILGTVETPPIYKKIEGALREIVPRGVVTYIGE